MSDSLVTLVYLEAWKLVITQVRLILVETCQFLIG